ncbi:hypothetical protein BT96DRAFT_926993 [Gymnopus androsaceus JB14]|uniref:Uncharacterized protein n=1 Tax=Gymnopus androsaceus JB14 TaxID=1447944 RepID=A0A6A4GTY1_9AGAR|nr:hypothetical protein BT96DRAFT_926993 [Gymnopus androsaceus JB14]
MPADFRHGFKSELRITPTIDSPLTNSVKNHNKKRKKSGKKQKAKAKTAPEPLTTEKLDKPTDPRLPLLSHICLLQVTSEDVEESVEKINALLLEIDSRSMLILDPVGRGRRSQTSSAHQSATTSQPPPARTLSQPSTERTKTISFTGNKILDNYPDSDSDAAGKKARKE